MNQILSTSMPKDNNKKVKNKTSMPINSIVKFFSIVILMFGIFLLGAGGYKIYKNQSVIAEETKMTISIENKSESQLLLKVMHQKNIAQVEYGWNDQEKIVIEGNYRKYIEEVIQIPDGVNTLYVKAIDENGQEVPFENQYEFNSNINLEVAGNKIKITYDDEKQISYMTYKWDEEQEEKIEINSTQIEEEIEAKRGLHTLTVSIIDDNNNIETKVQKINGVSKPKLEIDVDDEQKHFVIKASDEIALEKIELRLNQDNGQRYMLQVTDKEIEYVLPMELQEGENIIEVTVYNSNGVTEQFAARFVK